MQNVNLILICLAYNFLSSAGMIYKANEDVNHINGT